MTDYEFTIDRIKQALANHPDLCIDGFRSEIHLLNSPYSDANFPSRREMFFEPEFLHHVVVACAYFSIFEIDEKWGSYGLKHDIERWANEFGLGRWITNGCAILAASICGYDVVREEDSPNCRFRRKH